MADRLPYFPLYGADYLADTRHLTTQEHGAYLLLLLNYWMKGGLPDDEILLARIAGLGTRDWNKARPVLAAFFGDGWIHLRVEAELAKAKDKSDKRSEAGKHGNVVKRLKTKKAYVANAHANRIANTIANTIANPPQAPVEIARKHTASSSDLRFKEERDSSDSSSPTTSGAAAAQNPWEGLEARCRAAAGLEADPSLALMVIGPIHDLLTAGWSWEGHIEPVLKAQKAKGRKGSSWAYYAKIITDGAAAPPKAAPPPEAAPKLSNFEIAKQGAASLAAIWEGGNHDWHWPDVPTPDQPGSPVTAEHLEAARLKRIERWGRMKQAEERAAAAE